MTWYNNIEKFCEFYNIPLEYLADVLQEPKVIPMIRGKAFEFSAMLALQRTLPKNEFKVTKTPMNAQFTSHDEDISVYHIPTNTNISVECKLAAKGRFKKLKSEYQIRVKCMRSRTVGKSVADKMEQIYEIPAATFLIHSDQYLPSDFDIVITSIGNAFYETDPETEQFKWEPTKEGIEFLKRLRGTNNNNLKDFAFFTLLLAPASKLAITESNYREHKVRCTRRNCQNKQNCGFVPNYPIIHFAADSKTPKHPWVSIQNSIELFRSIAIQKSKTPTKSEPQENVKSGTQETPLPPENLKLFDLT